MVGLFKNAIKHALNNKTPQFDNLYTLAKEAEAICNCRPLTYVNEQPDFIPLRPVDFIRPRAILSAPRLLDEDDEWKPIYTTRDDLIQNWRFGLHLLDNFWKRWSNEYLTSLRERYQSSHPHPRSYEEDHPRHGEFVLIKDNNLKRGQWKLGQVCGSCDDYQRSVQIRLPSKRVITRPLNLISRFEINANNQDHSTSTTAMESSNIHPMVTRSKARQQRHLNFTYMSLALSALTLISQATTHSKCPKEINIPKRILHTTACTSQGAAVASYTTSTGEDLCWFPVQCPNGDIQAAQTSNIQLCGAKCKCPQWSQFCSHYTGHRTTHSTLANFPSHLKNFTPSEVCSFQSTPSCHPHKRIGSFNQIELYDQTQLIVPNLDVKIRDYIDSTDFICVNPKGEISTNDPPFKGTSFFCEKQQCDQNAKKFCLYDKPIALYSFDNLREPNSIIPIKAWGTVLREFYPHPLQNNTKNTKLHITCAKGGLDVRSSTIIDTFEACISSYCIYAKHISETTILFPTELIIFKYSVAITIWTDGIQIHNSSLSCSAQPICEILHCTFCFEYLLNSQCWDYMNVILIFSSCVIIAVAYWTIIPLLILTRQIVRIPLRILKLAWHAMIRVITLFKHRANTHSTSTPITPYRRLKRERRRERPTKRLLTLVSIVSFSLHFDLVRTCSDVVTMTSTVDSCSKDGENETCFFNQGTLLALQPLGQEVCLSMRNYQNKSIGLLTFRIHGIYHICHKKIEYFTRDHQFLTESSHRCYWAGSCKSGVCDNTKTSDKIKELSHKANHHPGFTFCTPSCQCCDGCFFCKPSCLFYRYFAVPTSDTIYTVFTCPTWELTVSAVVTLQEQDNIQTHQVVLHPGKAVAINNIKFSLMAITTPQLPILSATFIEDNRRTAQIMQVQANQLIPQTPAQFQCPSFDDAKRFNCRFAANTCTCSSGTSKTSCVCAEGIMEPYMHQNTLPLVTKLVTIKKVNNTLQAHSHVGSSVQVQVTMNNFKLKSIHTVEKCRIESPTIQGCYSCILGAGVDLICYSSETDTTADITCAGQLQIASCSKQGKMNSLTFHFDKSAVSINCTIVCSGGSSSFLLQGTLNYVNDRNLQMEKDVED
ncbi:unnamed protein product, partial [Cylicostephanus goldi]